MIQKIRNSRSFKLMCITMVINIFVELIIPNKALALTGGPAQPEFNSFSPIGISDMVDLASGDMNYNIPLMDVGGYPINIAYGSGVSMDEEASWVGLGWNLSVGQINRNVRGIPDDFNGDNLIYENYLKPNITVGADFALDPGIFGINPNIGSVGIKANYNNYTGFSMSPTLNAAFKIGKHLSVGFNVTSGPDGLSVAPRLSAHGTSKAKFLENQDLKGSVGVSMNSRQGLTAMSMSMSKEAVSKATKKQKKSKSYETQKGTSSVGSSIGFTDQLYTPTKRVGMATGSFTFNASGGFEFFGAETEGSITAYGTVTKVQESEKNKNVAAYGYANTDNANSYSILDFNREKDGAISVNTTNLAITNYTYDIYSIQGQGVSGTYRPFRNQVGYVYDPFVQDVTTTGSLGLEFGTGNAAHVGVDMDITSTYSHSGMWNDMNYILNKLEEGGPGRADYEKVHYKNVGDLSADDEFGMFTQMGNYRATQVQVIGDKFNRKAASAFNAKNGGNSLSVLSVGNKIKRTKRHLRNQAIFNITKQELGSGIGYGPLVQTASHSAEYTISTEAKNHHINEVQIIRNDGARYIYGLPAYNNLKKEATFAVSAVANCQDGLVYYDQAKVNSPVDLPNDKYLNRVTTPGYVHSHLLTSVLSTDYYDVTGDGPSDDDFGSYTKFTYIRKNANYKWRIPFQQNHATHNEGLKTDTKDDQGNYVYGKKELYYIDKIETKTHVAEFHISARKDAHGVLGESGGLDPTQDSYKLDSISLYSVQEYGQQNAVPIKVVHFEYSYSLCPDVPNNDDTPVSNGTNELSNFGGKLTLKKIYFTYRNSSMGKYTNYKFRYNEFKNGKDEYTDPVGTLVLNTDNTSGGTGENPTYNIKGYDFWGNYKPNNGGCGNLDEPTAAEFSFTEQDKSIQDVYAAVWNLKKINLPSGGVISVDYESDDYAYVQNRETHSMYKVRGAGLTANGVISGTNYYVDDNQPGDLLYKSFPNQYSKYLYVEVEDDADTGLSEAEIIQSYLGDETKPIYFRILMNMTQLGGGASVNSNAKYDYVSGYFEYDRLNHNTNIFEHENKKYLSLPVNFVDMEGGLFPNTSQVNPISKAGWHFGRKYLNQHVYSSQPNGDTEDVEAMVTELLSPQVFNNLIEIFTGPNQTLENKRVARRFSRKKSWIKLRRPDRNKLGGGCRVKTVRISDVWESMNSSQTNYQTMNYGQRYSYLLENGITSSGVATYEPVGNKENPFVEPVFSTVKHLLAPNENNYVEGPFGESFFPSPQVTYSRVEVASLAGGDAPSSGFTDPVVKKMHRTGKVVTEFYTSKDYPTIVDQTPLYAKEDKREVLDNILSMNVKKHFTASQGFVVHLNDMNGKQKAQWVYAEGQSAPISGVKYLYDNYSTPIGFNASIDPEHNKGLLDNRVKVINPDGTIQMKTIGVEVDMINDFRENQTESITNSVNMNVASFFVGVIPGIVPMPLPDYSKSTDQFRAVSTTKVINTFGLLKETIAFDAGASVSTRNLAWDAVTGEVLVTETVDEFNDRYYTMNYPAHWHYKGMGQASANLGFEGSLSQVTGNQYSLQNVSPYVASDFLIDGDEINYGNDLKAWVVQVAGNYFKLIDEDGAGINNASGSFKVIRSGHRNLQSAGIMNITLMRNPLLNSNGTYANYISNSFLMAQSWDDWKIINAGAVDYSENWRVGCECGIDLSTGTYNPYVMNEKGVWRTKSSRTYLTGRNSQTELTPRVEGFFNEFEPMYKNMYGHWVKIYGDWTYVAEVTKYSPYGFELENVDALTRYSAAQYGYNNTFPMAVGANTQYREIGFDGFEDHNFDGCPSNAHFSFIDASGSTGVGTSQNYSHTGKSSFKITPLGNSTLNKTIYCAP